MSLTQKEMMEEMREDIISITPSGVIKSFDEMMGNAIESLEKISTRGNGGATDYYKLPEGATELKHIIRHKNMGHAIGEAFCALYRLNDNGEYERNLRKALFYIQSELDYIKGN